MKPNLKTQSRRAISLLMAVALCLGLVPTAFAQPSNTYTDPAEHWVSSSGRTAELDVNAVVTEETFWCCDCREYRSFLVYRVPEYTANGTSNLTRNIPYSDGVMSDGETRGTLMLASPKDGGIYTGYHWTKAVCQTCGTLNSNWGSPNAYTGSDHDHRYGNGIYKLYDCSSNFFEKLPQEIAYAYTDSTYHTKTTLGGDYCQFCYGTHHTEKSVLERHDMSRTVEPQPGHHRFLVKETCADCGYSETTYVAAKSVIANYYGEADGKVHTLTVSNLSDSGVKTSIRYGNTAETCNQTTPPSYTEAGQYTVYYAVTYTYGGKSMTENGAAYVWLHDKDKKSEAPACGESNIGHTYSTVVIREADCENEGKTLNICTACNHTEVLSTPKGEHEYKTYKVPATCTAPGYTVKECITCGEKTITDITGVLGHSYRSVLTPATCEAGGHTLHVCTACGDSYIDSYTDPLGHQWDKGTVIAKGTCTGQSVTQYTCTHCEATRIEGGEADGHVPGETATCTNPQTCTVCGAVLAQATGHHFKTKVTAPTCTAMGYTTCTCKDCGVSYKSDYTNALGHNYKAEVTAPTCEKGGYTTYTCANCGDSYVSDYTEPLGHTLGTGVKLLDSVCNHDGMEECTCIRCAYHELHAISATGHTPGKEATCTEPQLCTKCGAVLKAATGHDYATIKTPATCTEMGYTTYICKHCGESYKTDYTLPTGHDYKGKVTAPTCETGGYTTFTCANCGDSYVSDETVALGHEFDSGEKITASACTHEGVTEYTCIRCPYHELHAISATGHTPGKAATCTEAKLCTTCGAVLAQAKGHTYKTEVIAPTCTEMGYTVYTCADCGNSYQSDYTEATGHRCSAWIVDREPTTENEGHRHTECEVCGKIMASEAVEKLYLTATTDSRGEAVVNGYLVIVTDTDSGNPVSNALVVLNRDGALSVRLPDGRLLDYGEQTTVTVLLKEDKSPVKSVSVSLTDRNGNYCSGKTDAEGKLTVPATKGSTGEEGKTTGGTLDSDGNESTLTIRVMDGETGRAIEGADASIGKTGNITVVLPDGTELDKNNRITVVVTDNRQNPIEDRTVIVKSDSGKTVAGETDAKGTLTVPVTVEKETHGAYIYGYPDGTFCPEQGMTRAEATAVFARLLAEKTGDGIQDNAKTKFSDVAYDAWFSGYVKYLTREGVATGYQDGTYCPDEAITRSEFVALAVRFFEVYGDGSAELMEKYARFDDVSDGDWAAEYIEDAAIHGWVKGYGDGSFRGNAEITRAEVVTIVNRLLDRTADEDYIADNLRKLNTFTDMSKKHWAYYDVMESANAHTAVLDGGESWQSGRSA